METDATYRGTVYPWQCDHIGHMNIMWYVGKFDEANWNMFARLGLTPSYLRQSGRGMAGVQQNISYKRELFAGDIIEVTSKLLELRDKSIRFLHEMRNAETGEIAAPARSRLSIWTGRRTNRRPSRTPFAPSPPVTLRPKPQWHDRDVVLLAEEPGISHDRRRHLWPAAGDAHARYFYRKARTGRGRSCDGLFDGTDPAERLCARWHHHRRP